MNATNRLRRALERGDPVFGAGVATFSPTVIETFGDVGLDYAWLDLEHGGPSPYDSTAFEDLTRAADAAGIELLVRIPTPDPALVRKVLDAGVRTILVPRVETAEEVRRAVRASRFSYDGGVGDRGVGGASRTSRWGGEIDDHVEREDGEALVGVMIENERAVGNLESILSVPDLGFAFVGPADLSVSLGRPMEKGHPDVRDAAERTSEACLDAGVPVGCIRNDPAEARAAVEDGYRVLRVGGDLGPMRAELSRRLDGIGDL
ncbi:HpcH/HpaI aldolase family protein [Halorarum salinum]|uniref:Aldolase n=1 Tax=Halorarum salinum TaxID=2743089 RepID=A0A7D5QJ38_9EURY|nr:aldolase/citrate lyase family protein [Halobaculum salinum]QLG61145.1 aldolase [Halobaculum salinum]